MKGVVVYKDDNMQTKVEKVLDHIVLLLKAVEESKRRDAENDELKCHSIIIEFIFWQFLLRSHVI
jgi:hypothetical protein